MIVRAAKRAAGYDEVSKTYRAASLAMHYGTTLKQITNVARHLVIKRVKFRELGESDPEEKLKSLKRFSFLVKTQWTNEVSALAGKCLTEKRFSTPTMLPLTEHVQQFQDHLVKLGDENQRS
uniref:Uncharacterized protein n=1 Tax=Cacopsylla melanoneura TaxID=428564 RepID=A0A8D8WD63_9HEMI